MPSSKRSRKRISRVAGQASQAKHRKIMSKSLSTPSSMKVDLSQISSMDSRQQSEENRSKGYRLARLCVVTVFNVFIY